MYRMKSFIDIEKEERWLREMSAQGWGFSRRGSFGYCFDPSDKGEQIYRIDYRDFTNRDDFTDYLWLFHDAGWDHVAGTRRSGYQYFMAQDGNPDEDIFSDDAARTSRYRRLAQTWATLFAALAACAMVSVLMGSFDPGIFADPKSLYLTPGLWDAQGTAFWMKFLFETPFVIMRNFGWVVVLVSLPLCLYYAVRFLVLSKKRI